MFSPLARGKASWDGDLQCETYSDQTSPAEPLLPHLINHTLSRNKSARSSGSFLFEDGQLALPKTFVTRKGAILLFTPSSEVCNHGHEESHSKKENVYEAGLRLRTVGNLTNSVLEFGKEEEEAWEGVSDSPKEASEKGEQPKRDKASFLRFLHYLDSENLTADKNVQPGADPDYYLEELKKKSGHNSHKRFRSQTPFSTRSSHSTNAASHYSQFLDDDDEITSIIQDYIKCGKSAVWSHNKEHLEHRTVSSDHMPDTGVEGRETLEDVAQFSSPRSPRTNRGSTITFSPSMPSMAFGSTSHEAQDSISRPKTAPIPATLESPRANPRITSGKPPPLPRALGSTPNHLDEILNADVGFGRYHRRGPNPRLRLSRSPPPSFQLGSSRGTTPDFAAKAQRLATSPDGKIEEWNRTANVIKEEDEPGLPVDQTETGKRSRRPSSAESPRSGREEKVDIQRRASSAGTTNRITRSSLHSSRSASFSSASHYNRGQSALSRDVERHGSSPDLTEMDRDDASSTWPGMRDDLFIVRDNMADHGDGHPTGRVSGETVRSGVSSPASDNLVKSPSPPPRSPSVASRSVSLSPRSPSVQSRRETMARSGGSSAISSAASEEWQGAVRAAAEEGDRESSSSSRNRLARSQQSGLTGEEDVQDGAYTNTRTSSAKTAQEGVETRATLGSEADLAQVSETIVRSQSVVEGVYENLLLEEETGDEEWPSIIERGEHTSPDETIEKDEKAGITGELAISTSDALLMEKYLSSLPVSKEESLDPGAAHPETLTGATEHDEKQQEKLIIEVQTNEAMTSVLTSPELHESEASPYAIDNQELKETETVVVQSSHPVRQTTADTETSDETIAVAQDSTPSSPDVNLTNQVKEGKESLANAVEKTAFTPATVTCSSSPAPIKAGQILHKELLSEARLEPAGKVDDDRASSPYKETIDMEKSRPSSPVTDEQRGVPVSIGEAVRNYIESGQEPQVRDRSARSRRSSEIGAKEKENEEKDEEKLSLSSIEKEAISRTKPEAIKSKIDEQSKPNSSNVSEKPSGKNKTESKPDYSGLNLLKSEDKAKEVKEPTDKEREARRQIVSSFFNKHDAPRDGKLELEGIGKEGEGNESSSGGLVTRTSPPVAEKKNDLSDLAALVNKNKTTSKLKEKKTDSKKKSGKQGKSTKKKDEITIDPENIDFEAFNTPDMLDGMDDELRQFIQEQSKATSATDNGLSGNASAVNDEKASKESVQTLEMPQVARKVPLDQKDAHAPSKPKKLTKKELAKIRADQRKEERKKKEEERRMKEEEICLLKEREEEAVKTKAEAEEKQRNIEEEKMKRLAEEEEAKQQEQEALEKLKEAKKKAREERELRRAAEAERRRLEVQRKREEKKKREEELKEREKELEQQKMNREKRMAEIEEARRRKEELERLEEEQRREEERLLELQREEEERMLEEEKIREAEEELRRLQEEREYREQMRRIAEIQEAKLRQEEEERLRREEAERQRAEEEKYRREEAEQERLREEQRRIEMARRLEALARMRSAQAAARRKALLLKRREDNVERMQSLKHTRCGQGITRAFVFTYYTHIPRKVWEVPIGFNKKKKGFGSPRRKPAPPKPP